MWSRWAVCSCPAGVAFLGRDGVYISTDSQAVNITDEKLYPLFPHDGAPATSVTVGSFTYYPVDMTKYDKLRLSFCDNCLQFNYVDTNGVSISWRFDFNKKRWLPSTYADSILLHYLEEGDAALPTNESILLVGSSKIYQVSGYLDSGVPIAVSGITPSYDGGDERSQKLYVDLVTQASGTGTLGMLLTYDNATSLSPLAIATFAGPLSQSINNISSLSDLEVHRNVGLQFGWTGASGGVKLYAWEPSGYMQPYISLRVVTQYITLAFPGWKHLRRAFPALVSNGIVALTIVTQDGRTYGPFDIASTAGQFRVLPMMLSQNIKDLAFLFQLDGGIIPFALFVDDFVLEVKEWTEDTYIKLAVFKT